jgi:hypothetical protein
MSNPKAHHYVPVFYLKQWANDKGLLTLYTRPWKHVVCDDVAPSATGYEHNLYTLEGVAEDSRFWLEKEFMARTIDSPAAEILKDMLRGHKVLDGESRSIWTRFIVSLMMRTPESVRNIQQLGKDALFAALATNPQEFLKVRTPSSPETLVEWVQQNAPAVVDNFGKANMPKFIDSPKIVETLFKMHWCLVDFRTSSHSLLSSDRPLVRTAGLGDPACIVALPLGPRMGFFACGNPSLQQGILRSNKTQLAKRLNVSVITQARKYIYGADRSHKAFVEMRLPR